MTPAAPTPKTTHPRLLMALLLSAAGLSAFAQTPDTAIPADGAASAPAAVKPAARPMAKPALPALTPPPTTWSALPANQRELLGPLQEDWSEISPSQRSKWLSAAPVLATMPPDELARVHERMRDWARMSPAERQNARISFQVTRQVGAGERQAKWEAYQALPAEERQALADKAAARRTAPAKAAGTTAKPLASAPKSNVVPAPPKLPPATPVAASLVQAKPGATTVLMTRGLQLPSHQAAGETKVVADPALVNPKTLLPRPAKPAATPRT